MQFPYGLYEMKNIKETERDDVERERVRDGRGIAGGGEHKKKLIIK